MNIVVFVGPTITPPPRHLLDATWLPPVEQGDVLRAVADGADIIGIVDGYFDRVPSVWHKEILAALAAGVHVFGAASMGALRAAELHTFGMVGVGDVFAAFRDGTYEDDDEVAVMHLGKEENYRELSEAMVNLRDRSHAAVAAGVLGRSDAEALMRSAKDLHYPERTYARLCARASERGLGAAATALASFAASAGPSLKQRDALAMVEAIARLARDKPAPFTARFTLERTVFLDALQRDAHLARRSAERAEPSLDPEALDCERREVLLRLLARDELARRGVVVGDEAVQHAADTFRRANGLSGADDMLRWMRDAGLALEDFTEIMRDHAGLAILDELYAREVDWQLPQQLQLHSSRRVLEGERPKCG